MARIALGQVNLTVGDLDGNVSLMADRARDATAAGADLVVFPELAVTGYPPEDLVLRRSFVDDNLAALATLGAATAATCPIVTGFVDRSDAGLHNALAVLREGGIDTRYHKCRLPNYGVFDEERYFEPGAGGETVDVAGTGMGLSVCEDAWLPGPPWDDYAGRLRVIVNINGSPYHRAKTSEREDVLRARARETGAWIAYVNAVGGQERRLEDQVLGRVPGQGELGEHHQVGAETGRLGVGGQHALEVTVQVADDRVDLGAGQAQALHAPPHLRPDPSPTLPR